MLSYAPGRRQGTQLQDKMMHKQWMMARTSTHSELKIMNPTPLGGGGKYIFTRNTAANAPRTKVDSKSYGKGCHRTASFSVHADPRQRDHLKSALHFHLHTLVQGCEGKRRCNYHFKWGPPPSGDRYGKQAEQVISICMPHNQMTELAFRMTIPRKARATKKKKSTPDNSAAISLASKTSGHRYRHHFTAEACASGCCCGLAQPSALYWVTFLGKC